MTKYHPNIGALTTSTALPARRTDIINPRDLPEQYALPGKALHPAITSDDKQMFSTVEVPKKGDVVAVWRNPEALASGEAHVAVYRLEFDIPEGVEFGDTTRARTPYDVFVFVIPVDALDLGERLIFRASEIIAVHKWVGIRPAGSAVPLVALPEPAAAATEQTELSLLAPAGDGPLTMSSAEIAELTGKEHKNVIRDIRVLLDTVLPGWEKDGSVLSHQGISITYDNRGYVSEIRLPKDLTITLVAGYDANLRLKIVRRWMELEAVQPKQEEAPQFPIPQTFAEALMLAANQAAQIEHQKTQIVEMAPKAEFHDDVAGAVNAQDFMSVAKAFGTGRTRFVNWLRARKFIMENRHPYQQFADAGYFRVIEKKRKDKDTGEKFTYTQTLITGKGVTYLHKKWIEDHKEPA